jgi:PAS domain S-box-containing protein
MEDELRRLVDALPGLIWTAQANGQIDFVNRRWCEYTGLSFDEARARWHATFHPEDLPTVLERWPAVMSSSEPFEIETRLRSHDGAFRWFSLRASPLLMRDGHVTRWCGITTDIDARKRSELALRALEVGFREICDSIPGLVAMSSDGEVELFNRDVLEYFGRTAEEMKGWANSDAVHPDDLARVLAAFTHAIATGTPYAVEHRCRRADGVYRWFLVRALPVRQSEGRISGWYVLLTDIDDRKQAEDAIRASERNLNLIINAIPALAWSALPDGSAEFFNQHYLDYVGVPQEQAQGVGWTNALHPDDLSSLVTTWQQIMASGKVGEAEARLRRFDGVYRWFLFRASPLLDEAGAIVKWYGTNTDIDDRKRTEEQLRRSEAFLAEGERLNLTGSFCWCPDTDDVTLSEQFLRIFAFADDERVTFEKIASRVHPDDLPVLAEKVALARRGISDHQYEIRLRMPDGSIKYLRTSSYGTRGRHGRVEFIGSIQDVTERRVSEQALSEIQSELAHMTRVASLGALTASIAHEVNQPLSGIITNASTCLRMLASEPPNVEGARETARRTIRDGNRASEVITRLRALFSKKELTPELLDLNEAAREVIALSRSELQRARVVLRVEFASDLPSISGDKVQLQQVILNLLLNALAAMSSVEGRPRQLSIRTEPEAGGRVRLTVQDTGVGLDLQTVERLFEAFYTTKTSGMGLGLSVSRSIIESHGGRLWAEANPGSGATFSFSVPGTMEGAAGLGAPANGREPVDGGTATLQPRRSS